MDWQPIETAPKTVQPMTAYPEYLLLWNGFHRGVGHYQEPHYDGDTEWWSETGEPIEPPPTHWMPLPPPPINTER